MRLIIILYILISFVPPAYAYIEENNAGDAEASAGDQNTNLYRLNARGDYYIKRLKKIDEFAAKGGGSLSGVDISSIEGIDSFEQKDREEQQNKKLLAEVVKAVSKPATLVVANKPEIYSSLTSVDGIRDAEVAITLQKQLKGRWK